MAFHPFQFLEKNAPKSERERPSTLRDWPPCPPIQRDGGRRSRPGVNPFISALTVARCPATFPGVWPQLRDTLSTSRSVGRGTGAFIYALSADETSPLMKPVLRLRLHATQSQPCFPAVSNALAIPGGNGIFTATPTERITHYTLQAKSCAKGGALPPLETPTRKGGTLPLHGARTAFSCYPALRLYRLSKSQRGIGVVSLTMGNSELPFAHRGLRQVGGECPCVMPLRRRSRAMVRPMLMLSLIAPPWRCEQLLSPVCGRAEVESKERWLTSLARGQPRLDAAH